MLHHGQTYKKQARARFSYVQIYSGQGKERSLTVASITQSCDFTLSDIGASLSVSI
ncbi:protein of unknown function [Kyrpidia spormannii]|uniref:Uncharacterized protein n=2 Tax=Kyrpidia spormannii TaxID=2055160 RepID=A0ACA8Z9E9_9BACL|nr:protein of unknown function [Kyrpidia spormannii]CAB3392895.1 protein of unknown function [Kyrpidia spormannii]